MEAVLIWWEATLDSGLRRSDGWGVLLPPVRPRGPSAERFLGSRPLGWVWNFIGLVWVRVE